jgi:hypothetical protein
VNSSTATRIAMLGLKVADPHHGHAVTGLRAWAWDTKLDRLREQQPAAALSQERQFVGEAQPGRDGVLAWHSLPRFGRWSTDTTPTFDPWAAEWQRDHSVVIVDPLRYLHPIRLQLPLPRRELVTWNWAPGDVRPALRAYPSSTHRTPDGVATVRARLWDPERQSPASWAMLSVQANGHACTGLAGEDGEVVVFVPFPRPRTDLAPAAQSWPLKVAAYYSRLAQPDMVGTLPHTGLRADLPLLADIERQPLAQVHGAWTANARSPFVPPPLTIRGELYLAANTLPAQAPEYRLFVTPVP